MSTHNLGGKRRAGGGLAMALLALMAAATAPAQSVTIDFVTVGYTNNPSDPLTGLGSVGYEYQIGKYEVTNAQYAAFLNAVAKASDPYALYNSKMADAGAFGGGITRSGSAGSYSYAVKSGYENKPVGHVSYWDAARFANWVSTGTTEGRAALNGPLLPGAAYDLNFSLAPTTGQGNRLADAAIALPTQDEWYKAAYYQPAGAGGPSGSYWLYPTKSDAAPTASGPSAVANRANFNLAVADLTVVGSYTGSSSYLGTFDQGGNVWEWNTTLIGTSLRQFRGGSWFDGETFLRSSFGFDFDPAFENDNLGFRVASLAPIPEPSTYAAIAGLASLGVAMWRRRAGRGTASA